MIATLLGLAGYLLYFALMMGLFILVIRAAKFAFPSLDGEKYKAFVIFIAFALPFVLKDTLYLALISGFPSTKPSSASEMIATLAGLAGYLVNIMCMTGLLLLVIGVVLAFLPLVSNSMTTCAKYTQAAGIITLAVVLKLQPPVMPIENPTLIIQSPSTEGASNFGSDGFIRVSEQPSVEHKMVMEKIDSGFNMLTEESKGAVQSFVVHKIMIPMTLIGATMFFVWIIYRLCKHTLTEKSKQLMEDRVPLLVDTPTEKRKELPEDRVSSLFDTLDEKSNAMIKKAASEVDNLVQDQKYHSSGSFGRIGNDPSNPDVQLMDSIYYGDEESVVTVEGSEKDDNDQARRRIHMPRESSPLLVPGIEGPYDELEKKLQNSNATPMHFPLEFLKAITCDFSTKMVLGQGGFGVVYKGVLTCGKIIAVKKLFENFLLKEETFQNEVCYHMGIKHPNVVQLLGCCAESSWHPMEVPSGSGKYILAETMKRLLCFEFVCNKSLSDHISDGSSGLEWNMRYKIIKGICNGLHFLHEECHMVHLDLKPQNILMDSAMVPKIADFGLSRIFGEQQSRTVTKNNTVGTPGYMAPEYLKEGVVSYKADIFSLGVITLEIIAGGRVYPYFQQDNPHHTDPSFQQFIEKVLENWRNKFGSTPKYEPVETYTQQVTKCVAIALKCVDADNQKRPTMKYILEVLNAADQIGDSHFEMRETPDAAVEILKVKEETDAKLDGGGTTGSDEKAYPDEEHVNVTGKQLDDSPK